MELVPTILVSVLGVIALGGGWLLFKGKLGSLSLDLKKFKLEMKAPENSTVAIISSDPIPARDRIESKGDVHVHNYGFDADAYRQMLQEELQGFKKELGSGSKEEQEDQVLIKQIGDLEAKLANMEKTLSDRETVLSETQQALESAELKNAVSEDQLADALGKLEKGDSSEVEALLTQVLEEAETHANAGAEAAFRLGELAYDRIDYRAASIFYERSAGLAPGNSLYLNQTGVVADTLADYDKAIEYYEKALASDLKTYGPEHPDVAIRWNNLGEAWRGKGNYDKAIEYYEKALASDLKTFGPEHPSVARNWNNLGAAWEAKGDYDKAIGYFEKALASDLKTYGPEHPNVAVRWNNLGAAWDSKGEYDKAIGYYEQALASDLKTNGPEHPNVAVRWNNLGLAWDHKGQYDKAIGYYEQALASDLKTFGPEHPSVARNWNNLGFAWKAKGDYEKAIEHYEKALAIVEKANLPHRVKLVKENIAALKNQR